MSTFTTQIPCEFDAHYSLKIVDDGRVAYAYLLEGDDVVGDVWLYNRQVPPQTSFWLPEDMPFLNPKEYLEKDGIIRNIQDKNEIRTEWTEEKEDGLIEVGVYIREKFIASVAVGEKPGRSVLVVKDGPLALVY